MGKSRDVFFRVVAALVANEFVGPYLLPFALVMIVGISSWISSISIPLPYLITAMVAVFAFSANGLLVVSRGKDAV